MRIVTLWLKKKKLVNKRFRGIKENILIEHKSIQEQKAKIMSNLTTMCLVLKSIKELTQKLDLLQQKIQTRKDNLNY